MGAGRRTRLGVLGGTFDPIHNVHLLMARRAARALELDCVLFVPAGTPSHRDSAVVSPASDRCEMVARALAGERRFTLSTIDVERPGPTYTVDTLSDVRAEFGPNVELYVIIGADNLANLLQWHDSERLLRLGHFVGLSRLGYRLVDPGVPPGRLTLVEIPCLDISGTRIRALVRDGRSVRQLTPDPVTRYIVDRGLYQSAADGRALAASAARLEYAPQRRRLLVECDV